MDLRLATALLALLATGCRDRQVNALAEINKPVHTPRPPDAGPPQFTLRLNTQLAVRVQGPLALEARLLDPTGQVAWRCTGYRGEGWNPMHHRPTLAPACPTEGWFHGGGSYRLVVEQGAPEPFRGEVSLDLPADVNVVDLGLEVTSPGAGRPGAPALTESGRLIW